MKDLWEATRVENPAEPGTPDVFFTTINEKMGWIELKHRHEWPKRALTPVKFDHYTPQQKSWIRRHSLKGANVMILAQVEDDYMIFRYPTTQDFGKMTKKQMMESCCWYAKRTFTPENLLHELDLCYHF